MWDYFLYQYGNQIVLLGIGICFFGIGCLAKKVVDKLLKNKIISEAADKAVSYVEQVYTDIHGADKLAEGISALKKLLEVWGISLTEAQLTIYIEAALAGFNKAFEKTGEPEETSEPEQAEE